MSRFISLLIVILIIAGCSQDTTPSNPENEATSVNITERELDEVVFMYKGQDYQAKYYIECLAQAECEDFSQKGIKVTDSLDQLKEAIKPGLINAEVGDKVQIKFPESFSKPDFLSYQKIQGGTAVEEKITNQSITIKGEKDKNMTYIIDASWGSSTVTTASVKFVFLIPPKAQ
ncbi:hypothetical protein [Halobacillus halophilus]|uniref:hypothetical protein n=1 Tax=Halobacillus halophilus TaxID=1570 RepID=UPI001CD27327|nr:hypothetical protein [Halobacillus halophilus]MCA1009151.1 hypothetical protein [Halobacillus halophilus]